MMRMCDYQYVGCMHGDGGKELQANEGIGRGWVGYHDGCVRVHKLEKRV